MGTTEIVSAAVGIAGIIGGPLGFAFKAPSLYLAYAKRVRIGLLICIAMLGAAWAGAWFQGEAVITAAAKLVDGPITDHAISREEFVTSRERFREILRSAKGIDSLFEVGMAMAIALLALNEFNRGLAKARLNHDRLAVNHIEGRSDRNPASNPKGED